MARLIWLLSWVPALAIAACGAEDYQRPRTIEYITMAILAPNCGNAQCHSALSKEANVIFDTVEDSQQSLLGRVGTILVDEQEQAFGDPEDAKNFASSIMNVLTRTVDRMPYDQPLPEADIQLIADWIEIGAPDAQCIPPSASGGGVCAGDKVVLCKPDYNFGGVIEHCDRLNPPLTCVAGTCR